jgi:predicted acetyltransferase
MKLIKPNIRYKKSFKSALYEFEKEGNIKEGNIKKIDEYIKNGGIKYKDINIKSSTYWLIDKNKFIGRLNIRHNLNDELKKFGGNLGFIIRPQERKKGFGKEILRLGIKKAEKIGFKKILITCNEKNIASRKIIEKNGGLFENKIRNTKGGQTRRYWINI